MQNEIKTKKEKTFLRKYSYYIAIAIAIICIATLIATLGNRQLQVQAPEDENKVPVNQNLTFVMPLSEYTVLKDFSATELMLNKTLNQWEAHKAIDYLASEGAMVKAICAGKVTEVYTNYLDGTVVVVSHGDKLKSVYSSLGETTKVSVGDNVTAGQEIGIVAASAKAEMADGAHLHLEVLLNNERVNPNTYFVAEEK